MAFLTDGYQTLISCTVGTMTTFFKEKETQAPELDMGGPIDITTMRNLAVRTAAPKHLKTVGPMKVQVMWDPTLALSSLYTIFLGANGLWSVTFPDGQVERFYGYMDKFTPASYKEGELPLAELTVIPTNISSYTTLTEASPTFV